MDACLVFPSMPAVMRLNKLGTFSMAQLGQSKSPFAEFMRSARKNSDNFEENLLKLVRTLPTVLKYLPSQKAQDARVFVQVDLIWLLHPTVDVQLHSYTTCHDNIHCAHLHGSFYQTPTCAKAISTYVMQPMQMSVVCLSNFACIAMCHSGAYFHASACIVWLLLKSWNARRVCNTGWGAMRRIWRTFC